MSDALLRDGRLYGSELHSVSVVVGTPTAGGVHEDGARGAVPVGGDASRPVLAAAWTREDRERESGWGDRYCVGEESRPDISAAEAEGADETMSDERWRSSYDGWKTRSDDPGHAGRAERGIAYACLDCEWNGRGGVKAFAHHRESRHHRIIVRDAPQMGPLPFGCCSELAVTEVPPTTPSPGGKDPDV